MIRFIAKLLNNKTKSDKIFREATERILKNIYVGPYLEAYPVETIRIYVVPKLIFKILSFAFWNAGEDRAGLACCNEREIYIRKDVSDCIEFTIHELIHIISIKGKHFLGLEYSAEWRFLNEAFTEYITRCVILGDDPNCVHSGYEAPYGHIQTFVNEIGTDEFLETYFKASKSEIYDLLYRSTKDLNNQIFYAFERYAKKEYHPADEIIQNSFSKIIERVKNRAN